MKDVDRIKNKLKDSQEFLSELGAYLDDNFLIEGKKVNTWKKYFKITIPDDINFQVMIDLTSELATKYQIAASYRDRQNIQASILDQSKFDKFHEAYQCAQDKNKKEFGKPLAAKSCEVAAELATRELKTAISNQKVVKDFWNKTCETLTELRKILEQMGYALSADARAQKDFNVYANKNEH